MSAPISHFIKAPDGLKLHVREYGSRASPALAVVCLAGLTRTCADFEVLATALSADGRRVLAPDYRGRGRSDYDTNPDNYNVAVELADVLAILRALKIGPAVFIGTSRGGILTMMLASVQPDALAGAVLNDIGPVIEIGGLLRIRSYVGKLPQPATFEAAAAALRRLFGEQFPRLSADDWMGFARRTFEQRDRRLVQTYDPSLAEGLKGVNPEQPLPMLWKEFDALASVPLMIIRGSNSDLLSQETVGAMAARHPGAEILHIPDQGHPPLLTDDDIVRRIGAFVSRCEAGRHR
jgi:pimeloyl-ACP methyl ester carboxylesterase